MAMKTGLTGKQRAFVEAYLSNGFNGVRAAESAGYQGTYSTLNSVARENLQKPAIKAEIDNRLKSARLGADEVLALISEQAKASLDDFLDDSGRIDLSRARERGKLHLLKSITQTTSKSGNVKLRIELHDAQSALSTLGKHLQLFTETHLNFNKDVSEMTDDELDQALRRYGPG